MSDFLVNVSVNESPLPATLDKLYDFVHDVGHAGSGDLIAIMGAIVEFDVRDSSPLYNDYVVRAFADRTIRMSPMPSQDAGDLAERYSSRYMDMLTLLASEIDNTISEQDQEKIQEHTLAIAQYTADKRTWLNTLERDFAAEALASGIDVKKIDTDEPTRTRYDELRTRFMQRNDYAETRREFENKIRERRQKIAAIRMAAYATDEDRMIVNLNSQALDSKTYRPKDPDSEKIHHWDAFSIQNPENEFATGTIDVGPMVESIIEPSTILKGDGEAKSLEFDVSTTDRVTNNHDNAWHASGGGNLMKFFSGGFSGSGENHFRSTVTNVRSLHVGFKNIARLDIARGPWFSRQFFEFERVKAYLKKNRELAKSLSLLTTSLIVGRGMTLTLYFKDASVLHEWGSTNRSGSGGLNIGGFRLGGSGGKSASWESRQFDEQKISVTFKDDDSVCRLLGVIVTSVDSMSLEEVAYGLKPLYTIPYLHEAVTAAATNGAAIDAMVFEAAIAAL